MTQAVGAFARSMWLQYVALFQWATPLGFFAYMIALPVTQIVFFVQLGVFATGPGNALYFALGNSLQLQANSGIFGVIATVSNERQFGTLPLLLGSPANRLLTFMSRSVVNVLNGIVSVVFALGITSLIYGLDLRAANLPLLGVCILVISITTAGLGLLFGSLGLVMRDSIIVANVVYYGLLILCGVNFPVGRLPGALQAVAYSIPLTRGVQAARAAVTGADFAHVAGLLAGELLVGAIYAGLGYALFRFLEGWARRGGLQEAY